MANDVKQGAMFRNLHPLIVAYGYFLALVLMCCVLVLSFSVVHKEKAAAALKSVRSTLAVAGPSDYCARLGVFALPETGYQTPNSAVPTNALDDQLAFLTAYDTVRVVHDKRGVSIVLPSSMLFALGNDVLLASAEPLLQQIGQYLSTLQRHTISVEGHTDTTPVITIRFPSNWHLAAARAISVVRYLHDQCDLPGEMLVARARAEFAPMVPNDTATNRECNNRIVIVLERTE